MSDNGRHEFDPTPEGRIAYLEALLYSAEPYADHKLTFVEHLDHEDPRVRAAAIQGLWRWPDVELIARLIQIAEEDPSPMVRAEAVSGLGIYMYQGAIAEYGMGEEPDSQTAEEEELTEADFARVRRFLLQVHANAAGSAEERRFALESLAFLDDPQVIELIEAAYLRPEQEWKSSALCAMGRSGDDRWKDIVARELYSAQRDVQVQAIRAAGEIGLDELGKDLWRLTYAEDLEVKLEAIEALGYSGWEEAFDRLDELTLDSNPDVAEAAEDALDEWFLITEPYEEDTLDPDADPDWDEQG